ncbi:hypothetical protein SPBR_05358 [Sporothrix brasiliensis 5110]|uniref:Uncharacterized protein n=1 Tax=Sporothrix brasiliensis 5110 TaxID=1398154 RepID=A0A0C2F994_9PEZI|nr:uncharacterized protein SPBR_05358 [Sporothrix brasiliensis 5110]KIH87623.1 hypothetical protein SPBR_05358 [Sporothrix brasiliensis 5110]
MTGHLASYGRGGAGNMADSTKSPKLQPKDLETPVLRTSVVTTGRGGTGNMAKNTDPKETRARQDVEPSGATHAGRGGAGNVFKAGSADAEAAAGASAGSAVPDDAHPTSSASSATLRSSNDTNGKKPRSPTQRPEQPEKSLATKGKEWLLGKK